MENTLLDEKISEFKEFLTDLTLIFEDQKIYVSKVILASVSPVFRRMFESDFKEKQSSEMTLPGKKYEDVIKFLQCIYPNMCKGITGNDSSFVRDHSFLS